MVALYDKEFVLKAVKQKPFALRYASKKLKGDEDVVLAAVTQDGGAFGFASEELKGDRDFVLKVVKKTPLALYYVSGDLKGDKDFVLKAVKKTLLALRFASEELKGDKDFVLKVVGLDGRAFEFASEELKSDEDFVLQAVKNNGDAIYYALNELIDKVEKQGNADAIKKLFSGSDRDDNLISYFKVAAEGDYFTVEKYFTYFKEAKLLELFCYDDCLVKTSGCPEYLSKAIKELASKESEIGKKKSQNILLNFLKLLAISVYTKHQVIKGNTSIKEKIRFLDSGECNVMNDSGFQSSFENLIQNFKTRFLTFGYGGNSAVTDMFEKWFDDCGNPRFAEAAEQQQRQAGAWRNFGTGGYTGNDDILNGVLGGEL